MIRKYNYLFLLCGLLFMLLGGSVGTENPQLGTGVVFNITVFSVFIFGVWALLRSRIAFITGWALGGLTFLLTVGAQVTDNILLQYLALLAILMFFFLSCCIAVYDVLFGGVIDFNRGTTRASRSGLKAHYIQDLMTSFGQTGPDAAL